ncbi:MAG: DUF5615 family PIN-like protein [Pseudomonadota bacterium]
MTFLIDENLSWRLGGILEVEFPDCRHVTACGLERADDVVVWSYARANGLSLLSKDDHMRALVETRGAPPRLVWVKLGNAATQQIALSLRLHADAIRALLSGDGDVMEIS